MKTKNEILRKIALCVGAILFSTLLYQKSFGLNIVLITTLLFSLLTITNKNVFKNNIAKLLSGLLIIAAVLVFWVHSSLSILNYFICLLTFIGYLTAPKASIYVNFINGVFSLFMASIFRLIDKEKTPEDEKKKIDYFHLIKLIGLPFILILVFTSLYRNVSPYFNELILKIDLSFINIGWIVFSFIGYYILNNLSNPINIEALTEVDANTPSTLDASKFTNLNPNKLKKELSLGITLIGSLNILILLFTATDLIYLATESSTEGILLSQSVHKGVNALITSILLAISIMLYFFRGNLNFFKKSIVLKRLAYIWLALNIIVVAITFYKNYLYIQNFGFTYKRIGVYVYLFLAIAGLISTYIKLYSIKNIWFLIRFNTVAMSLFLFTASCINWDSLITNYNLNQKQLHTSIDYLISLSDRNAIILKEYADKNPLRVTAKQSNDIRTKYLKHKNVLNKNTWQELILENYDANENSK